jgi:hypothetical protein
LTYDDSDLPTHYAFKVGVRLESLEREYRRLRESGPPAGREREPAKSRLTPALTNEAAEIVAKLDDRGAWVETGRLNSPGAEMVKEIIDTRTFISNVETLSRFIEATNP